MNDKDKPFKHIVIVGCGDIGQRVAKIWKNQEKDVFGASRNESSLDSLRQQHIHSISLNLDNLNNLNTLPSENSLLYYFAPPPAKGIEDTRMANFLKNINKNAWIVLSVAIMPNSNCSIGVNKMLLPSLFYV